MVEGPGTTRNGRKASRVLKQAVRNVVIAGVRTPATETAPASSASASSNTTESSCWWHNRRLVQVITIGKELFLIFGIIGNGNGNGSENGNGNGNGDGNVPPDFREIGTAMHTRSIQPHRDDDLALRVHFGMNGSLHVNKLATQARVHPYDHAKKGPTLEVYFESNIIRTYETNSISKVPIRAVTPRRKLDRLHTHDVCSPTFSLQNVLDYLQSPSVATSHASSMISDVLLNQNILPGIGNVIKIEGLHEARIHPKRPLSSLSMDELDHLIVSCRDYSMKWLNTGKAPSKYVYNQSTCGTCTNMTIAICRVGGTDRTTFWCRECQLMEPPRIDIEACRPKFNMDAHLNFNASTRTVIDVDADADEYTGTTTLNTHSATSSNTTTVQSCCDHNHSHDYHNHHNHLPEAPLQEIPVRSIGSPSTPMLRKVCPTHGPSKIILRRSRKKGPNDQRIFYTCKDRQCNFFAWADMHFPKCKCGKKVVMRISKTSKTGGKWFFSCAKRISTGGSGSGGGGGYGRSSAGMSTGGCGHFQWVEKSTLERYGHLLTPLL